MISVVVLTHGTGSHLAESLESVARQSFADLEVLVVDDATGHSVDLPDERFRLVKGGPLSRGAGRNLGVSEARGDFLAFVEDGDLIPPQALELLHAALAGSGSDFASGNVSTITEAGTPWRSWNHKDAFARPLRRTHIRKKSLLLHDRYVTGKVFRRSFWDATGLTFPDGSHFEDLAVAIPAHYLAAAVDILPEMTVYRRKDIQPALTTDPQDLADGFAAVAALTTTMEGRWRTADRRKFELTLLDRELRSFLDAVPDADAEERAQIVEQAAAYAADVEPKTYGYLPALTRLKWHLASRRLIMELVKVVRYERGKTAPSIVRNPVRRYVVYPYWKDDKLAIPEDIYRARGEVRLQGRVRSVEWKSGKLVVTGEAYINSVSMRRRWTSAKGVVLRQGNRLIPVRARQTLRKKAWTGFEFTLNPRRLRGLGGWKDGVWDIKAGVFNAGVFRHAPLKGGSTGSGSHPPYAYVTDEVRIVPQILDGALTLRVETVRSTATALSWTGDTLEIKGSVRTGTPRELTFQRMDIKVVIPVTAHGQDFTAQLRVSDLPHVVIDPSRLDDTRNWNVSLDGTPLVVAEDVGPAGQLAGEEEVTAARTSAGYLQISQRTARFLVTSAALREDGTIDLHGRHPVHEDGEIVLRSRSRRLSYAFPLISGGASVPVSRVQTLAGRLPLRQGKWDVLYKATDRALAVTVDDSVMLPSTVEVALRSYSLERQGGRLVLEVGSDLLPEENNAGTKLRQEARARVKENGLREAVLFSCFNGRQYSDSTRAIHEELVRRGSRLEQLWVVGDGQVELPPSAKAVRLNGADYHEAVASSKYIVTNHRLGDWFYRHPDQTVLQTWHGTPLKKIGRDIKEVHFAYAPGMQKAMATSSEPKLPEWTHLVSPNRFSTEILKRAFKFTGEMIEAGYPRNDVLYAPGAAEIAASVRARVGVPDGKKVVLYAPTWRDDQFYGRGRYKADWRIDLDAFEEALGDDHVLLARLHPNVVDGAPEHPLVYDVSSYPDIAELYLAADLMVSDYSSVMFDYANLRRPMLFYTYDLAHYRDKLRGFYFDFETEAPGPLLETSAQLVEAIRDIDKVAVEYESSYDKFYDRFCSLDDGHAAARVVDRVFPAEH